MKKRIVNEAFIERCNLLKEEKGGTLETIEQEIGISKGQFSKYMNGLHLPNSEVIRKLALYWGVSADYLLGSSDLRHNETTDGKTIPMGYVDIIKDAMKAGVTESEFREVLNTAIKFKTLKGQTDEKTQGRDV